jgi:hypothetical protein
MLLRLCLAAERALDVADSLERSSVNAMFRVRNARQDLERTSEIDLVNHVINEASIFKIWTSSIGAIDFSYTRAHMIGEPA